MLEKASRKPKPVQWWLEDVAHLLLDAVVRRLSGPQVYVLGAWLGGLAWHLMSKRRRIVIRNLRIVTGGRKTRDEIIALARECFRRTGANLVCVARTAQVPADRLHTVFRIRNPELMEDALGQGRGLVLLLSHMGNWELLSRISRFFPAGTPCGAFYRPLNNPRLDRRVLERREADGVRMFSKRDNPLKVAAFLREGGAVGILADQRVGPKGDPTRFFGRFTRSSPLPTLLARRAKCPVLALSLLSYAPGVWEGEFIPVEPPVDTGNCMTAIENAMKRDLSEVFWFQERWKTYLSASRTPSEWLGEGSSLPGVRHRALLWNSGSDSPFVLPSEWAHPDISYEGVEESGKTVAVIRQQLRKLEWDRSLPVDFILARQATPALRKACKAESIHLVVLA